MPLTSLFVSSRGPRGECDLNASADLIYPYVTFKPVVSKIQGVEVSSVRAPAALQVYGEDIFKPTDLLLRRLAELLFQDREHAGLQVRCNQGDSLYIYHSERVAVVTMHLEDCSVVLIGQVKQYFAYETQHQHGAFAMTGGFKYVLFSPRTLGKMNPF